MATSAFGQPCISRHSVMIHDRGGVNRLWPLVDITSVKYGRKKDGMSTATIVISGRACRDQASVLRQIMVRRHEVVLFRGNLRPWEGPIVQMKWFSDRVEILAHDVLEYVSGRSLTKAWPNSDGGGPALMTDRIEDILVYELDTNYQMLTNSGLKTVTAWENLVPPINVLPYLEVRASATLPTRSNTEAFEMTIFEHLYNLGAGGLEYTVVGRKLVIWDREDTLGRTKVLTEADFYGELEVIDSGQDFTAISHVSGQRPEDAVSSGPGDTPGVGHAGQTDSYYGSWEQLLSLASEESSDTPTQTELNSQAQRNQVGKNPVPKEIRVPGDAGIRLGPNLTLNDLVPGVEVPVRAQMNLRPVAQLQQLEAISVSETPEGETIGVTLISAGSVEVI